jgi:lipoprotein-releasing system permease protein
MLVFKIALRYLLALRKASTVQILSFLSFLGILLGSLAMLLVLSAFNGFEDLLKRVYHFQDPDLRIETTRGKFFSLEPGILKTIQTVPHVKAAFEVLTDKASLQYGDGQMVVEIVGMDPEMVGVSRLDTSVKSGSFVLRDAAGPKALVSAGIQNALNISMKNVFEFLKIAYPKRKKILKLGTGRIFNQLAIAPGGIVQMDENRVYIPIQEARILMDKSSGMNYLDVYSDSEEEIPAVQKRIQELLGDGFEVKNEAQQHSDLYKVMMIEKLFVFLALGFIILISTFNLFVSSTMLVLDKRKDIKILAALGLEPGRASTLIRLTGGIITLLGLTIGILTGVALCLIQKEFGIIPLGMATTLIQDYPVDVRFQDVAAIAAWVLVSGSIAMILPGKRAKDIALGLDQGAN